MNGDKYFQGTTTSTRFASSHESAARMRRRPCDLCRAPPFAITDSIIEDDRDALHRSFDTEFRIRNEGDIERVRICKERTNTSLLPVFSPSLAHRSGERHGSLQQNELSVRQDCGGKKR